MNISIKHPTFILIMDKLTSNIISNVTLNNYFTLSPEKKISTQYLVLKTIKNSFKVGEKINDDDLKNIVRALKKKNVESERYEIAGILSDIEIGFSNLNLELKSAPKNVRTIKVSK
jgi:hypothetical protein